MSRDMAIAIRPWFMHTKCEVSCGLRKLRASAVGALGRAAAGGECVAMATERQDGSSEWYSYTTRPRWV